MRNMSIAAWTHSCMVFAASEFPWYLVEYDGQCKRVSKDMDFEEIIPISDGLVLKRKLVSTLMPKKGAGMKSVLDILAAQPKGYDIKFTNMRAGWLDTNNKPHHATFRRVTHRKKRTVEKDYEASVRSALDRVRETAIRLGVKPPFLTSSYMVMETIDGLPMEYFEEDELYRLIGTHFWTNNPLSRVLYDIVEQTITKRGVPEYKVIPRERTHGDAT